MVKVHQGGEFECYIYSRPREHFPPQVRVECARGGEAMIRLGNEVTEPCLLQNHHMRGVDVRRAIRLVRRHQHRFLEEWMRLHG